jgi:CCR4-NOT transcription complex subunit 6
MLERKSSGSRLMLANAHIHWDPKFRDVKVLQVTMMMDELQNQANGFAKNPPRCVPKDKAPRYNSGTDIPLIICGDFNSIPSSGVYDFMSRGFIEPDHEDFMQLDYGNYIKDGRKHAFPLKSAYARLGELPFTNLTPGFQGVIDYIWHSTSSLEVIGLLKDVDKSYLDGVVGFPNAYALPFAPS